MDIWHMIADQRRQLIDRLDGFNEVQWRTPSLCTDWTVREVVGHLITPFELGTVKLLLSIALNGFNFNKAISKTAIKLAQRPTAELVATLRANIETQWTPPGLGPEAPLGDIIIHTQDICRPLGIEHPVDGEPARCVLDFIVGPKGRAFANPALFNGLRLVADDLDWSWGNGPEVRGTAVAIIMAISRRTAVVDDLKGDGVEQLRLRLA